MPIASTANEELTCAECGYHLRTLPLDSNCPECGHPIPLSLAAVPLTRWLPGYRCGVTYFLLAILALTFLGSEWLYRNWLRTIGTRIDHFASMSVFTALIFFPAAWWLSKPANFLPANPARLRKWLIVLTTAQLLFAAIRIYFMMTIWAQTFFWRNFLSVTSTALLAPAFDVEIWLLLNLLIKPLPLIPHSLPRALLRGVQALLLYSLLCPDIIFGMAVFASLYYIKKHISPGDSYFPSSWRKPLDVLLFPVSRLRAVIWWVLLLVVLHSRYRLHGRTILKSP